MREIRMRAALLTCGLVLCAGPARADDADTQRSSALFREGVAAGKAGDYACAQAAFRASYSLTPSGSTLRNWALTEMKLGQFVEALRHLKSAVSYPSLTAEQRAIVQQNLEDAYAATGHIALKTNDGARVAIDGNPVDGAAPFDAPVDVIAGSRHVEARLGMRASRAEVEALPGRVVEVTLPVAPDTQPTPAMPHPAVVAVAAPASEVPEARHPTWWTTQHAVGVGLAGAAAVAVGLGLSFELASQKAASDANALRANLGGTCTGGAPAGACGALRDQLDTVHQEDLLKWTGFAVGAVAGVGSLVLLVLGGRDASVRTGLVHWTPMVAPGASGVRGFF
jgi:tetratricopeptide (TPR) repeat protein